MVASQPGHVCARSSDEFSGKWDLDVYVTGDLGSGTSAGNTGSRYSEEAPHSPLTVRGTQD